uniref:Membrane insertase YidC/Oxa/ALB C-terminal domain-containing protein n=1 Tax=Strongyloides stercoralis TaxID=6248 RepID=A0A0K0DZ62_STRER
MLHLARNGGRVFSKTIYRSITSHTILNNKSNVFNEVQCRGINTKDIFNSETIKDFVIPESPLPPLPRPSITELLSQGESLLSELSLFSWYTPTSYLRYGMEWCHLNFDMPWWSTIMASTVALRLLLIYLPIISRRNAAIQSKYRNEMKEFNDQMQEAKLQGDHRKVQHALVKQHAFMKEKGISMWKQSLLTIGNGAVFLSQFLAIKKFTTVQYPGFETGGILWFDNLLLPDPYYILPVATAITMHITLRLGVETAGLEQFSPLVQTLMLYGVPVIVLTSSCLFPSAIGLYWLTSNLISLSFAGLFKVEFVRNLFKIQKTIPPPKGANKSAFEDMMNRYRATKCVEPSLSEIRNKDLINFRKAGKSSVGKP